MISFDLDMTLLDHRTDQITPSALEAIEAQDCAGNGARYG